MEEIECCSNGMCCIEPMDEFQQYEQRKMEIEKRVGETPPIVYYQASNPIPMTIPYVGQHCGFCNKGKAFYGATEPRTVIVYDKETRGEKYRIELPEDILSITAVETTSNSALVIVMNNLVGVVNLAFGNLMTFFVEGAQAVFSDFKMELDAEYFYFVIYTQPISFYLFKFSVLAHSDCLPIEKKTMEQFQHNSETVAFINISYPTFSKHMLKYAMGEKRPFIECSDTGRKPFTRYILLEEFVPNFVSLTNIRGHLVVIVGGSNSIMFAYDVSRHQILFSLQLPSLVQSTVAQILYNFDHINGTELNEPSFVIPILYMTDRTTMFFYKYNDDGLDFVKVKVFDHMKHLGSNVHMDKTTYISVFFEDKKERIGRQMIFTPNGDLEEYRNVDNVSLESSLIAFTQQIIPDEYVHYYDYIKDVPNCFLPSYIYIMDESGWKDVVCSSVSFQHFVQGITLLPPLIMRNNQRKFIDFYNYLRSLGFNLPEYNEDKTFILESLKLLIATHNMPLLIEELNEIYKDPTSMKIIEEYFREEYSQVVTEFTQRIMSHESITSNFMVEIEERLQIIHEVFLKCNVDSDLQTIVDLNLYAVRYFTPSIHLFYELLKEPVENVDGTLISPMIDLFMPGFSYPIPIDMLILHLFNNKFTPAFQTYLSYLFVIHDLTNYLPLIPEFSELREIPDVATVIAFFDSGNVSSFIDILRMNTVIKDAIVYDILPTAFTYYTKLKFINSSDKLHTLIEFVNSDVLLLQYFDVLIATEKFGYMLNILFVIMSKWNVSNDNFRNFIQEIFQRIIQADKIYQFFSVIYNTVYEHHFMNYVFICGEDSDIIKMLHFYLSTGDIFSVSLLHKHLSENIWKDNVMGLSIINNAFEEFKAERTPEQVDQMEMLRSHPKFLQTFINGVKEITLGSCSTVWFDQ